MCSNSIFFSCSCNFVPPSILRISNIFEGSRTKLLPIAGSLWTSWLMGTFIDDSDVVSSICGLFLTLKIQLKLMMRVRRNWLKLSVAPGTSVIANRTAASSIRGGGADAGSRMCPRPTSATTVRARGRAPPVTVSRCNDRRTARGKRALYASRMVRSSGAAIMRLGVW